MAAKKEDRQILFTRGYHAAVLLPTGDFVVETFESAGDLATRLKELIDRDVSVYCFSGDRLQISKPPYRYLMTPEENIPLYNVPEEPEPDDTGYLGVDPAHLEDPTPLQTPPAQITQPDEFFSDDTNEIRNIFDDALPDPDA
jgi:hypothetical protein